MQEGASGAQADDVALAVVLKCGHATIGDHARADLVLIHSAEEATDRLPLLINICDRPCKEANK
jgi:hypothetical protein